SPSAVSHSPFTGWAWLQTTPPSAPTMPRSGPEATPDPLYRFISLTRPSSLRRICSRAVFAIERHALRIGHDLEAALQGIEIGAARRGNAVHRLDRDGRQRPHRPAQKVAKQAEVIVDAGVIGFHADIETLPESLRHDDHAPPVVHQMGRGDASRER